MCAYKSIYKSAFLQRCHTSGWCPFFPPHAGHLVQRKRRKTNVLSTSQQSAGSSASKTNAGKESTNDANGFCSSPPKVHGVGKLKVHTATHSFFDLTSFFG